MSYFDYFRNKVLKDNISNFNIGTCDSMCPEEECLLREKENLVHILELRGSEKKYIKSFRRSAAASNIANPSLLRPFAVLHNVLKDLFYETMRRTDVPIYVIYEFITDRLKAVRQDAFVQELPHEQCLILLEPMIRFHVYFGFLLCNSPLEKYDPVLNNKCLLECIQWYLNCCDFLDHTSSVLDLKPACVTELNIDDNFSCDRILVESLYILCNLESVRPLFRYYNLPQEIKRCPSLQLVYKLAIANMNGNYVRVCRFAQRLCPLTKMALEIYLPTLQRRALKVMCQAYNSRRHQTIPVSVISDWLSIDTQLAMSVCCHYNIDVAKEAGTVKLFKDAFKVDTPIHSSRKSKSTQEIPIEHIFTYKCSDYYAEHLK